MRTLIALLIALYVSPLFAQDAPGVELPKDPDKLLGVALPFYNFSSSDLKPWHTKVSYQTYDDKGNPIGQGTFEYWWASPQQHRSTWTRSNATHTDWYTPGKLHAVLSSGDALNYFEYELQRALVGPLPSQPDVDPVKYRLEHETIDAGKAKLPCVMVIPRMPQHAQLQTVPLGLFPTYCFDVHQPVLLLSYSFASVTTQLGQIVRFQDHYIPRHISIFDGRRKLITASVDVIDDVSADDPVFTPSPEAIVTSIERKKVDPSVQNQLLEKRFPVYPDDAKRARVSGTVVLQAVIGTDGRVHDLKVLETPWPSLTISALQSVSHWRYKPYTDNGRPIEVDTIIKVVYSLSR